MAVKIDRCALVHRHNPIRYESNPLSPMQVGNGRFAFGVDVTGLQTFVPFATMSEWGWKHDRLPDGQTPEMYRGKTWKTHGRDVVYDMPNDQKELSQWLISNPNRLNLARIGLWFNSGQEVNESDLNKTFQKLDLWTGTINSSFEWNDTKCNVTTSCHPYIDALSVVIESPALANDLSVFIDFPYCDGSSKFSAPYVGSWNKPSLHSTSVTRSNDRTSIRHSLGDASYYVHLSWNTQLDCSIDHLYDHRYKLNLHNSERLELTVMFESNETALNNPSALDTLKASELYWHSFWSSGGTIDLSLSTDKGWFELERRLVLSQYVMAVNETGNNAPQESGLVNLGWYGKFHLEMNWFHSAYLALFGKWELLRPSLSVYERFLTSSIDRAQRQGYKGARWPKMTDNSGGMAQGKINALLIWQEPHPIMFAELDYRAHPTSNTLKIWKQIIFETAEFMVSYATLNKTTGKFDLGPPLHVVSENTDPHETHNAAFELEYWRTGLNIAVKWFDRLGETPPVSWTEVASSLAPLPVEDDKYILWPGVKNMWKDFNYEHPALAGLYGWLPGNNVDKEVMLATSKKIWATWRLDKCWGWDFGILAMNAARLGHPERSIEFLLNENMPFDDVGLVPGGSQVPFPYFPANGSFLYAIAMMAAGWDDSIEVAPGFPSKGWKVLQEGLYKAL